MPSGCEPAREILRMLLGQQFGRRHQRGLVAGLDRASARRAPRRSSCRSRRRPAPGAASGCGTARSAADLGGHALLRARSAGIRWSRAVVPASLPGAASGQRRIAADFVAQRAQGQLVREQFLECQAALRGMAAGLQQFEARIRRRTVQELQRLAQARHVQFALQSPAAASPATRRRRAPRAPARSGFAGGPAGCPRSPDRPASAHPRRPACRARRRAGTRGARSRGRRGPRRTSPKQRRRVPRASCCCCAPVKWKNRSVRKPVPSESRTSSVRRRRNTTSASSISPSTATRAPGRNEPIGTTCVRSS